VVVAIATAVKRVPAVDVHSRSPVGSAASGIAAASIKKTEKPGECPNGMHESGNSCGLADFFGCRKSLTRLMIRRHFEAP